MAFRAFIPTPRPRPVAPCAFGIFLPAAGGPTVRRLVPVLYWLSGLTCTEEKLSSSRPARNSVAAFETWPRHRGPGYEPARPVIFPAKRIVGDSWQRRGSAWTPPRRRGRRGYRMYPYISAGTTRGRSLASLSCRSGAHGHLRLHSMGGHGCTDDRAQNPSYYRSVSAFAPISSPMRCPWEKRRSRAILVCTAPPWRDHDATALIEDRGWSGP